ncbi:MAG: ABC transporter ATP-binding protein [Trueperaceae bacterium]|nr:ABC transporter ATP-binding protein [Trueperaceae bacterium]
MALELDDLSRRYGAVRAVNGVNLTVPEGATVALLGPSGCGKSTLLRLVAGLEPPDHGAVRLDGADLRRVPPQRRGVGMVFQDYALFPHMDVATNVAFGLVERGWPKSDQQARVQELLSSMGMPELAARRPHELSGGQQQRVALARALAPRPSLLLLDEPLSNLDRTLRDELGEELATLLAQLDVRAIHVTHDQTEAFALADRVAVMREGRIAQEGTPDELVEQPRNAWVARFLGLRELLPETTARTLGFPGPVLLRTERLTPHPDGHPFEVRRVQRVGTDLALQLASPEWGVQLTWHARPRELASGPPQVGDTLHLRVPDDAWTVLEVRA